MTGELMGLGVMVPLVADWHVGAIVVAANGTVLGLEHQWPPPDEEPAANDPED